MKSQMSTHISFENKRGNPVRRLPEEQGVHFPISRSLPVPQFTILAYSVPTSHHRKWKHILPCIPVMPPKKEKSLRTTHTITL